MREWTKVYIGLGFIAAMAAAGLCFQVLGYGSAERLTQLIERNNVMSSHTATWTSGGIQHSHTTTRNEGESAEDFARRHQEELDAMLLIFPRDP